MRPVIVSDGLSKRYTLGYRERYGTVRDSLKSTLAAPKRWLQRNGGSKDAPTIWALKDVSFEIQQGELVGIIGRNGSGKSTLLKILSRITEPTAGRVVVTGRVGSLLEVGTGFHPELTGRENIYVNGVILGMKRAEISRKFDEIVAFSEVDTFIDTPVKHYSSGMQMRLAFAVAAHLEPTILLVDEVLAVGDVAFQKKCIGKMGDVAREGRTVLFVSHDLTSIQVLCQRAIRLAHGQIQGMGAVNEQITAYLSESRLMAPSQLDQPIPLSSDLAVVRFGFAPNPVPSGNPATFHVELTVSRETRFDDVAALVHDTLGRRVGVIDFRQSSGVHEAKPNQNLKLSAKFSSVPLVEGEYRIGASIRSGDAHHIVHDLTTLDVTAKENTDILPYRAEIRGLVAFDYTVHSFAPQGVGDALQGAFQSYQSTGKWD
jgi:lipopolysaccharide transport system ATP-binding protein